MSLINHIENRKKKCKKSFDTNRIDRLSQKFRRNDRCIIENIFQKRRIHLNQSNFKIYYFDSDQVTFFQNQNQKNLLKLLSYRNEIYVNRVSFLKSHSRFLLYNKYFARHKTNIIDINVRADRSNIIGNANR